MADASEEASIEHHCEWFFALIVGQSHNIVINGVESEIWRGDITVCELKHTLKAVRLG